MSKSQIWVGVAAVLAVAAVAIFLLVMFADPRHKPSFLMTEKDRALQAVAQELIDPSSAVFRNVFQYDSSSGEWCGEVNGKNIFGAYSGFRKFYSGETADGSFQAHLFRVTEPGVSASDSEELGKAKEEMATILNETKEMIFKMNCGEDFLKK